MSDFTNPYNFVSLGDKCNKLADRNKGKLSGVLSCTITTKTPLFIPNTTNEHAFPKIDENIVREYNENNPERKLADKDDPKSFDFFSYEDISNQDRAEKYDIRPIIPGSSIRGVIRSAYETVTDSCLSTAGSEAPLHRRTNLPYRNCGVMKNGILYRAKKALIMPEAEPGFSSPNNPPPAFKRNVDITPWKKVKVSLSGESDTYRTSRGHDTRLQKVISVNKPNDVIEGYYLRSEPFGDSNNKHFDAVMIPNWHDTVRITPDDNERLKVLLTLYQENNPNAYKGFIDADTMPVYYEEVGNITYISPACISKEVFSRSVKSILINQGNHAPCETKTALCEACHLFGMVNNKESIASRIDFRDAVPEGVPSENWKNWYDSPRTLAILGEPHVSATEFYMDDPDSGCDVFNYDYKTVDRNRGKTALMDTPQDSQVKLRGRKFYWHSKTQVSANVNNDNPKQLWTVRPIKENCTFQFDIAFNRLTPNELSKLIWTLEIGERKTHAHKMGHGKPIGYGSVQIQVIRKKSHLWTLNDMLQIGTSPINVPQWQPNGAWVNEFTKMTNFDNCPNNVSYPIGVIDGKETVFNWFVLNREMLTRNAMNHKITNILPKAGDNNGSLPKYTKNGRGRNARYTPGNENGNRGNPNA